MGLKIKTPKNKNLEDLIERYNRKNGIGVEVFYNYKKGKLLLGDYYSNFNRPGFCKLNTVVDGVKLSNLNLDFLRKEIGLAKIKQQKLYDNEEKNRAEELARYRSRRNKYYRDKLKLK